MGDSGPTRRPWFEAAPIPIDGVPPPHDLEHERLVLRAALTLPGFLDRVSDHVTREQFYADPHRAIWAAIVEADVSDTGVDALDVVARLRAHGELDRAGGAEAVCELAERTLSAAEQRRAVEAARDVWLTAQQRQLALTMQQSLAAIYSRSIPSWGEYVAELETRIYAIARSGKSASSSVEMVDGVKAFFKDAMSKEENSLCGLVKAYDEALGLPRVGEYTLVGAHTGHGKTTFAVQFAVYNALRGSGVLYFSTADLKAPDLCGKVACAMAGVPYSIVRNKRAQRHHLDRVTECVGRIAKLPIRWDDAHGQSLSAIRAAVRRAVADFDKRGTPLRLVVVDYLQAAGHKQQGSRDTEEQSLVKFSGSLHDLATETKVHVLATSQLLPRRKSKDDLDHRPDIHDLKGAKAISFPAENVAFLNRVKNKDGKYDARSDAEIVIRKQRWGNGSEVVPVVFDASLGRFEDVCHDT